MKGFFNWVVGSKIGWCLIAFVWMAVFLLIDANFDAVWAYYTGMLGAVFLFGITLVFIAFAWVINPIREYKENKRIREEIANRKK